MRSLLLLLVLVALGHALPNYEDVREEWAKFKTLHGKIYHNAVEDLQRLKIYLETKARILKHNKLYDEGKSSYYLGVNQFADMLPNEYETIMPPLNLTELEQEALPYVASREARIPGSMDWRKSGAVTAVKNQGSCGSCWAFSTAAPLEGRHYLSTGRLLSLSEQELIDCSHTHGTHGCSGGWPHNAFKYIIDNQGIDNDGAYPYEAAVKSCRFSRYAVGATMRNYVRLPSGDENALANAVANEGPISVVFDSSHDSIRYYKGGVVNEPSCDPNHMAHAVTLVGYGTDSQFGDYWIIKNSWGANYGEGGYLRLARNKNNMCGITTVATYPLI